MAEKIKREAADKAKKDAEDAKVAAAKLAADAEKAKKEAEDKVKRE